jgi:polyvinyl alcohol dehydrogenase (cytochrome)
MFFQNPMRLLSVGLMALTFGSAAGLFSSSRAQTPPAEHGGAPTATNTPDPNHPGKAIYDHACAMCHANPAGTRAATFSQITGTSAADLRTILTQGAMKPMAAGLSPDEITILIGYLTSGQEKVSANWAEQSMCAADDRQVDTTKPISFGGFGVDSHSTRSLTAAQSGLTKAGLAKLEVAWAIGFPRTQNMGTGVTVMGDTGFVAAGGKLMALDTARGCARWVKSIASRSTPQIAALDGRKVLLLASGRDTVVMIDAKTGDTVWSVDAKPTGDQGIGIRAGVIVYKDKVIVPYSASGVGTAQNAKFECCEGHGAVVALSLRDGKKLWEYHTMKTAEYNGQVSTTGVKQRGPSGAPIWALPTIDEKRNRVIVATGENTSFPGTNTSDAIIAIDLDTGKSAWVFQAIKADIWNMACNDLDMKKSGPNCARLFGSGQDANQGRDFDFGATPILVRGVNGRDIVVDGQKSGHVWAVDAATGKLLWSQRIGFGSALGGVHWGVASDGKQVFAAVADSMPSVDAPKVSKPGVYAFRLSDGKPMWSHAAESDCAGERGKAVVSCESKYGFSAAPLVVDGQVIAGRLDGKLVVLDGRTGAVVQTVDTLGPIQTVNGVAGKGGSIDSHALSAGNGMVFVTSGYGSFGQTPGNVLIALKPTS